MVPDALSGGPHFAAYCERYVRHTKGRWAGRPLIYEPWQREFWWEALEFDPATGLRIYNEVGLGIPRKNTGRDGRDGPRWTRRHVRPRRQARPRRPPDGLVVHHSKKDAGDDFLASVSGTYGITGSVDTTLVIHVELDRLLDLGDVGMTWSSAPRSLAEASVPGVTGLTPGGLAGRLAPPGEPARVDPGPAAAGARALGAVG